MFSRQLKRTSILPSLDESRRQRWVSIVTPDRHTHVERLPSIPGQRPLTTTCSRIYLYSLGHIHSNDAQTWTVCCLSASVLLATLRRSSGKWHTSRSRDAMSHPGHQICFSCCRYGQIEVCACRISVTYPDCVMARIVCRILRNWILALFQDKNFPITDGKSEECTLSVDRSVRHKANSVRNSDDRSLAADRSLQWLQDDVCQSSRTQLWQLRRERIFIFTNCMTSFNSRIRICRWQCMVIIVVPHFLYCIYGAFGWCW